MTAGGEARIEELRELVADIQLTGDAELIARAVLLLDMLVHGSADTERF